MAVPSKLTSYFDAGRPVLAATDRAGITAGEIHASNGGRVVDAEDPRALVDAALALQRDDSLAAELGANGLRYRTELLGEDTAIDQFSALLQKSAGIPAANNETVDLLVRRAQRRLEREDKQEGVA
jgi:glycosyltransferase involved in cell wall biosynthesis